MHHASVFLFLEMIVQFVTVKGQIAHMNARFQHFHIGHDVFMGVLHRIYHVGARRLIANPPRAADIHANAV